MGLPGGAGGKITRLPMQETLSIPGLGRMGPVPGREDPLEEGTATHSSILAWRLPWTEEPGGLEFTGLQSQTRLK